MKQFSGRILDGREDIGNDGAVVFLEFLHLGRLHCETLAGFLGSPPKRLCYCRRWVRHCLQSTINVREDIRYFVIAVYKSRDKPSFSCQFVKIY